jgi:branched-chain amino acid aminotransferase
MSKIHITTTEHSRIAEIDLENLGFGRTFSDHMFVADYKDGEWHDFRIEPVHNFSVHPANMTFHYGQAIFEGLKGSKNAAGEPLLFRPEENVKRLNHSARRMCMPEFPEDIMLEALKLLIYLDRDWIPTFEGSAMYFRPFMIATDEYLGVMPSKTYKMVIIASPSGAYYAKPVNLFADDFYVRAAIGGTGEAKCAGNYAGSLYPSQLAKSKGFDQILWLDSVYHKYVQEVGTMNIFFLFEGNVLATPVTDGAILKGITRDSIIHIMREKGYDVQERLLSIDEIISEYEKGNLIEAFGAGTAAVVTHVQSITYRDKVMNFDESHWTLSKSIKQLINDLRSGKTADPYNFVLKVEEMAEVL